jgi:hypothetical protein
MNACTSPELLAVPLRKLADRPIEDDIQALAELVPKPLVDAPP